jgi:hypothetical protein
MVSSIKVSGSRLAGLILQVCGIYLLPWARICDLVAYRLTGFVTRCRGYEWYLSFGLLVVFLGFHVLVFSAISRELGDILGSEESPCVCHASTQIPRLGEHFVFLSIRRGSPITTLLNGCRALLFSFIAFLSCVLDLAWLAWTYPKSCVLLTCGLVVIATT